MTRISSSPCISSTAHKPSLSSGSGSQHFSFGHFRSYSMSALPAPNTASVTGPIKTQSSKPSFDHEDWDNYSGQNITKCLLISFFAAYCNTDDLLCIQIKNVAPTHTPNIIININAIKIVFEDKAGKSASPSSVTLHVLKLETSIVCRINSQFSFQKSIE
ncbi:unnamed protein product [Brassica oleracea]